MPGAGLAVHHLHKSYAVPVLSGVDLVLRAGEVHALVGANGAGKSTLTRVIAGVTRPDRGTMTLDGAAYSPASRREAEEAGVQLVPQEPAFIGTLTVAEQLFLTRLPRRFGVIDRRSLHARATAALARVGLDALDPRTRVASLGVGHQQLVAVAGALARDCRVLILDEPTAALSHGEAARLLDDVRRLRDAGLAILYISHRMEEVLAIADWVTVLRDGRVVDSRPSPDFSVTEMVEAMAPAATVPMVAPPTRVSRAAPPVDAQPTSPRDSGAPARRVAGLCRAGVVRDVSLEVRAGEIVGLYGLVGAGRTELLRAIYGADRRDAGRIWRGDGPALSIASPRDAVRAGIGLIPEDRLAHALLAPVSIARNVSLPSLGRLATWGGVVDEAAEAAAVTRVVDALALQRRSLQQPVGQLSGGNQQKVVVARWLLRDCPVLLVDEPTRGVDVAAKAAMHAELRRLAVEGRALLVVSSELDELTALCDRIVVMSLGRVSGVFARGTWRDADLQAAAFAGHLGAPARDGRS